MAGKRSTRAATADPSLGGLACPNPDCTDFNRFAAGNLSVVEWTGKHKHIRRLYCATGGHRCRERRGSLREAATLPEPTVVRIVKGLGYGCSVEATADICEVDPRTGDRLLERAGRRAADFHRRQLDRLKAPPEAVQRDELHGRVRPTRPKTGEAAPRPGGLVASVAAGVASGFRRRWPSSAGS